ncbi:MAG: FAD-dependent oxidoreductase [Lachnospiraceae bacterium]
MNVRETDVVVVAAGPAGLAAAITAAENDLKVVILEKMNGTGGTANMGMGPLGIETSIQKKSFNEITMEEAMDMHMTYTHFRADEKLVKAYFEKSADTIDWLMDMGVEFAGAFRYFRESAATWHIVKPENGKIGPRAAGTMVKRMTERARELGVEILLETPAEEIIMENGRAVGVTAKTSSGEMIEVRGKAVIVATGGFGNNAEMVKQELGLRMCEDFYPFQIPGITGDGLRMMWKVGAMKYGANIETIFQIPDNLNWYVINAAMRQPALLVNQNGVRFMNEGYMGNTTFTGNALALQPGRYAYCIMDRKLIRYYKKNGPDIVSLVHSAECFDHFDEQAKQAVEQNYPGYFEADTIEELAEKMGIDPDVLADTLDEYNDMCISGRDTLFYKNPRYLHELTGKGGFIAAKFYLSAYGTVGGVRIDEHCQVLDEDLNPVAGLYSAGSDANTIYGDSYNFNLPGNTMGFAVNSGRIAGESVSDYIAEMEE